MAAVRYPVYLDPATGRMVYNRIQGRALVKVEVPNQGTTTTAPAVTQGIVSTPPAGYKKVTNLYVDAEGELVIVYDP